MKEVHIKVSNISKKQWTNFLIELSKNYEKKRKFSFLFFFLFLFLGAVITLIGGLKEGSGFAAFVTFTPCLGYIGYHFYMKTKGLITNFTVKGIKEKETNIYITSESEVVEAKTDLTHLYNHLVD